MRRRTLGRKLLRLASSGNTDEALFQRLIDIIEDYLKKAFGVEMFMFLESVPAADGLGLVPAWGRSKRITPIRIKGGELGSLCGFSFYKKKPIWVVAQDQDLLRGSTDYNELWSELDGLPKYYPIPNVDLDAKTLVAIPKTNP